MIGVGAGPASRPSCASQDARASERECWIALSVLPGIGPAGFARLLARHGSAAAPGVRFLRAQYDSPGLDNRRRTCPRGNGTPTSGVFPTVSQSGVRSR